MTTEMVVTLIIAIIAVIAATWFYVQREKTRKLKIKFGPEYDRLVDHERSPNRAESVLRERQKRVAALQIRPLSQEERDTLAADWRLVQEHFVNDPRGAVAQADHLINEALRVRGYPMREFDQKAADLSVDHSVVVESYRIAHDIALRDQRKQATTEELRQALQHYRSLFEDVLEMHGVQTREGLGTR